MDQQLRYYPLVSTPQVRESVVNAAGTSPNRLHFYYYTGFWWTIIRNTSLCLMWGSICLLDRVPYYCHTRIIGLLARGGSELNEVSTVITVGIFKLHQWEQCSLFSYLGGG